MKSLFNTYLVQWVFTFALLCGGATNFAQSVSRIEGSPYPQSEVPERLFLTSESMGYSQKITLQTLQGMLARTKPEILRDVHGHAQLLEKHLPLDRSYYSNFNGLLARYADRFDGYILCEARTASVNVAISLCAVLNAIAVPVDIEQDVMNAGFTKIIENDQLAQPVDISSFSQGVYLVKLQTLFSSSTTKLVVN
jgi:hypothetical protein